MKLKNKKGVHLETVFNVDKLSEIEKLNLSWHLKWDNKTKSYYVKATETVRDELGNRKQKTVHLHRLLMDVKDPLMYVDHINHDTLDNRIANMRVVNKKQNMCNRPQANRNSKSGIRNVYWCKRTRKWTVQIQIEGINTIVGKFDDLKVADEFAKKMRAKHYGEFAGN
ncbi:HNH endonuclease [Paenibacillus barcinonensis]|uniref:HNH endonuclease n=1 Tax=Paenibacillus barcinonensis TaxID=198119 RepID=A0A2V4WHD3_PAEBA|nr:HNH endonuclease [Paenibacillus barcinonensis]PYE51560.1 HNH endonuclease [Paenibacillus barcinonensis]QKS55930.1 HNH endonuclease [Paenibacillus barcinonensis]